MVRKKIKENDNFSVEKAISLALELSANALFTLYKY